MATTFFMPAVNHMGSGCLTEAVTNIKSLGFKKALIVTDEVLNTIGLVARIKTLLDNAEIAAVVYDKTKPNPTVSNVNEGLTILKQEECDCVVSIGGGSSHDCAKGIALLATNGGEIKQYEGVNISKKPQLPLIAINTTAGTASEMTRFCIVTDEERHVKMAIVDTNVTPVLSVNDPELMLEKPASLTAATAMDALTHAIEAYVSIAATPVTDAVALRAITMIGENLRIAVENGQDLNARDNLAYAQFMAGMAFNNAGLGYVHSIAAQLGGVYDLPHGVCNAILLPHVMQYNAQTVPQRMADIANAMGVNTFELTTEEAASAAVEAVRKLSNDVNIPTGLKELGVKHKDIEMMAENSFSDVAAPTNPREGTTAEIIEILTSAM